MSGSVNTASELLELPENKIASVSALLEKASEFFDKMELLISSSNKATFNLSEAAEYCRCEERSILYHATRSKQLTYVKVSKHGLVFLKQDLDEFLHNKRVTGFRDVKRRKANA